MIEFEGIVELGGLYRGDEATMRSLRPWLVEQSAVRPYDGLPNGNIPCFSDNPDWSYWRIGDTPKETDFRLRWISLRTSTSRLLISHRVLLVYVSWQDLSDAGFIAGKQIVIDNDYFTCRLMEGGNDFAIAEDGCGGAITDGNEWDQLVCNAAEIPGLPTPTDADVARSITDSVREDRHNQYTITPWNFSLAIPAWKIAPGLAYGNTVVFKRAELVPGTAWALAEIISHAGLPDGAFNLVMGRGTDVGAALFEHTDEAGVTFTGSTNVGRKIGAAVFARAGKMQLEMGGQNPLIVLDDADLDSAVEFAINGSFYSTGQRCTASSPLIVTEGIHDAFVDAVVLRMQLLTVGDAREPDTDIGPVVSEEQLTNNLDYLRIGAAEGAKKLTGGDRVERATPRWYLSPALFVEARSKMQICREQIVGPIASVVSVADYDEALAVADDADDADYGLSAGIISKDRSKICHFLANIQAGMAPVHLPTAGIDFHAPFTGGKGSSFGPPEKSSHCREFFTNSKVVHARYDEPHNTGKAGL